MDTLILEWQLDGQTHRHTVTGDRTTCIGRRSDCDIVLVPQVVSRQHALISKEGDVFYVLNLSKHNHIQVNDQVSLAPGQRRPLQPGDVFRVGPVHFTVAAPPDRPVPELKIRCSNCGRIVDYTPEANCPWCGISLSSGETIYGTP